MVRAKREKKKHKPLKLVKLIHEFSLKFDMAPMCCSGDREKLIREKT
jgi:hypothetical protein